MDSLTFDRLTRDFASVATRRAALALLVALPFVLNRAIAPEDRAAADDKSGNGGKGGGNDGSLGGQHGGPGGNGGGPGGNGGGPGGNGGGPGGNGGGPGGNGGGPEGDASGGQRGGPGGNGDGPGGATGGRPGGPDSGRGNGSKDNDKDKNKRDNKQERKRDERKDERQEERKQKRQDERPPADPAPPPALPAPLVCKGDEQLCKGSCLKQCPIPFTHDPLNNCECNCIFGFVECNNDCWPDCSISGLAGWTRDPNKNCICVPPCVSRTGRVGEGQALAEECCPTPCADDPEGCCGADEHCCPGVGCRPRQETCCAVSQQICGTGIAEKCCDSGQTCTTGIHNGVPRASCCNVANPPPGNTIIPCDGVCCQTTSGIVCCPGRSNPCRDPGVGC